MQYIEKRYEEQNDSVNDQPFALLPPRGDYIENKQRHGKKYGKELEKQMLDIAEMQVSQKEIQNCNDRTIEKCRTEVCFDLVLGCIHIFIIIIQDG